jgi:RimJ/RimL family protein N-acetyltransferase
MAAHEPTVQLANDGFAYFGAYCVLRPIVPSDIGELAELLARPDVAATWRWRGTTKSREDLIASLWDGYICSLVARRSDDSSLIGFFGAYGANFAHRYCYIAAALSAQPSPATAEAMLLFVSVMFQKWEFRKLYAEAPSYNATRLRSEYGRLLEREAVLRGRERQGDSFYDVEILAIHRSRWVERAPKLLRAMEVIRNRKLSAP